MLRAILDVRWDEPDPPGALRRIEAALLSFSPGFGHHQCRGPAVHQVLAADPHAAGFTGTAGPRPFGLMTEQPYPLNFNSVPLDRPVTS